VAQGVPGKLRPQIILTFRHHKGGRFQPYAPAAFTAGENPGTHFQGLSRPQGTWFCRGEQRNKSPVTTLGFVPGTVRLVALCINNYATAGPHLGNLCLIIPDNLRHLWRHQIEQNYR